MVLRFIGVERAVEWAEKNFKKAVENINKTFRRKIVKNPSSPFYFCGVRFIESVYSEKCHLGQKILSALVNVRFMIVRFIEIFL